MLRRALRTLSATCLSIVFAALLAAFARDALAATTYSWTGSSSNRWSDPANWNPFGVPGNGDSIAFPAGQMNTSQVNDLATNPVLVSLLFNGQGYRIGGNPIVLTGGVTLGPSVFGPSNTFEAAVVAAGDLLLGAAVYQGGLDIGARRVTTQNGVAITGPLSGTGTLVAPYIAAVRLAGTHPFSGVIEGEVLLADGSLPNASLRTTDVGMPGSGSLQGQGTIGGSVTTTRVSPFAETGFCCQPQQPPGSLTVGSLTFASSSMMGSSMEILLNGTVPGTGHDVVNVTGGGVTIAANTYLLLSLGTGFVPGQGQVFTIVNNQGGAPVNGQFLGLAEGATLAIGAYRFQLSYVGGDGNDITLTCTLAPNVWTGAVDDRWSTPGNWSGGVPQPGGTLTFPPMALRTQVVNDLDAGTVFESIVLEGTGYRLSGNALGLTGGVSATGSFGTPNNFIELHLTAHANLTLAGVAYLGGLEVGGHRVTVSHGVQFQGPVSGSGTIVAPYITTARFVGTHPFAGTIEGDVTLVDAALPNASVRTTDQGMPQSGSLQGHGSIGGSVITTRAVPGREMGGFPTTQPPGILSVGSLALTSSMMMGSSMEILVNGADPGTGYDQVVVNGGGVSLAANTMLNVALGTTFVPRVGQAFTLVDNRGAAPVTGQFMGLPEGTTLALGAYRFQLTYAGGDGNDITLTCTLAPNVWTGGVDNRWSTPGNWSGGVPQAGDTLTFPPGALNTSMVNDLAAGTVFGSVVIDGTGYRFGGNAITLTGGVTAMFTFGTANVFDARIVAAGNLSLAAARYEGGLDAGAYTITAGAGVEFRGPVSGTGVIAAPYISAMRFAGTHPFAGVLEGEVILEDASLPNASIRPTNLGMPGSGSLQGQGTIGGAVITPRVAPSGPSTGFPMLGQPGMLNVGSLRFESSPMMGSSLSVQISGSAPGTGFSQVNSGGSVEIAANTFLGVSLSPSFVPTSGETYAIVTVGGTTTPANGTFMGMPEGTEITLLSVYRFKLSYAGGDGNDIVLVAQNGRAPTNTALTSSANPSAPGQAVTFTATVQGTGPTPTGTVTFRNGGILLGSVAVAGGVATFTTSSLAGGSHAIRAEYSGDPLNGGSLSPVLTQTVAVQGSTPVGGSVDLEVSTTLPGGTTATVDMLFDNVVSGGVTSVTASVAGPTPPDGFQLGNPPLYFDVSTTASFSGSVTLCFGWSEGQFADESAIGLWHFEGGAWVNVTTLLDTMANTVCGRTTSLSPFALMERRFAFGGFVAPVANAPSFNPVRAGAAVPVKFSLGGFHGLDVIAAGYPRSGVVACGTTAAGEPIDGAQTAGNSTLAYDATTGLYTYVWKTEKAWASTCRQLVVRFSDGTEGRANFELR